MLVKRELATIDQSVDWAVSPNESFHLPLPFFLVVLKGNAPVFGRVAGAIIYTLHIISLLHDLTTLKGLVARIISLSTLYTNEDTKTIQLHSHHDSGFRRSGRLPRTHDLP